MDENLNKTPTSSKGKGTNRVTPKNAGRSGRDRDSNSAKDSESLRSTQSQAQVSHNATIANDNTLPVNNSGTSEHFEALKGLISHQTKLLAQLADRSTMESYENEVDLDHDDDYDNLDFGGFENENLEFECGQAEQNIDDFLDGLVQSSKLGADGSNETHGGPIAGPSTGPTDDDKLSQFFGLHVEIGPEIHKDLADICTAAVKSTAGLGESVLKDFQKKFPKPQNIKSVKVPKVNPLIWQKLKPSTKAVELLLQKTHNTVLMALLPTVMSLDMLLTRRSKAPDLDKLTELSKDTLRLILASFSELSIRRRELIKPELNQAYKQLCGPQNPVGEFLFGDELGKQIREIAESQRLGQSMTNSQFGRGTSLFNIIVFFYTRSNINK
jgi:hypothetical protein